MSIIYKTLMKVKGMEREKLKKKIATNHREQWKQVNLPYKYLLNPYHMPGLLHAGYIIVNKLGKWVLPP